jgi:RNA polymerase subunit RPABC4/transcription elongation factor Spt4
MNKVIDGRLRFEGRRERRACPTCGAMVGPEDYIVSHRYMVGLGWVRWQMCRACRDKEFGAEGGDVLVCFEKDEGELP